MRRNLNTWTCHICGEERPDDRISVQTNITEDKVLGQIEENVRYCNDKAECTEAAKTFTFMAKKGAAMASRQRRPVGE